MLALKPQTLGFVCFCLVGCAPPAPEPILGVRLGMTPTQVRDRFDPAGPGTFRSEAMDEDFALVWEPEADSAVRGARHEFHLGQLVAMRLTVSEDAPEASGAAILTTDLSVLTRESVAEGVAITWLARSCPTHADEVRRRIRDHQ